MRRADRSRRGANAVEFALVMPVLLAVLSGVMDYGWYFHQQILMTSAVRDAVRTGAATPATASNTPEEAAETAVLHALDEAGVALEVTATASRSGAPPDQVLTLTVSAGYDRLVGLVPLPDTLGASMVMRLEDQSE